MKIPAATIASISKQNPELSGLEALQIAALTNYRRLAEADPDDDRSEVQTLLKVQESALKSHKNMIAILHSPGEDSTTPTV